MDATTVQKLTEIRQALEADLALDETELGPGEKMVFGRVVKTEGGGGTTTTTQKRREKSGDIARYRKQSAAMSTRRKEKRKEQSRFARSSKGKRLAKWTKSQD